MSFHFGELSSIGVTKDERRRVADGPSNPAGPTFALGRALTVVAGAETAASNSTDCASA